jgi:hypothetical protein
MPGDTRLQPGEIIELIIPENHGFDEIKDDKLEIFEQIYNFIENKNATILAFDEVIGPDTEFILKERIRETIINYEPRANLYSVTVKALPDENSYSASIVFSIINNTTPVTLDLVLRRVR